MDGYYVVVLVCHDGGESGSEPFDMYLAADPPAYLDAPGQEEEAITSDFERDLQQAVQYKSAVAAGEAADQVAAFVTRTAEDYAWQRVVVRQVGHRDAWGPFAKTGEVVVWPLPTAGKKE